MYVVLATSNRGKLAEFKEMLCGFSTLNIKSFDEIIDSFHIEESADTFEGNAIIKAEAVYEALNDDGLTVIADDSGISVPILNNEPGVYSARYAGVDASDEDNLDKLIKNLKDKRIKKTKAFYTCAMCIIDKFGLNTLHGFMQGDVIDEAIGNGGFGYDPMFVPIGHTKTVAQLDKSVKYRISHRAKAVELAKIVLEKHQILH